MIKKLLFILFCIASLQTICSQEATTSAAGVLPSDIPLHNAVEYNRFVYNPTFSLVREDKKSINIFNRNPRATFTDNSQTYFLNYTGNFEEKIGVGVGLFQQNVGIFRFFGAAVNFAYNLELDRDMNFTFGMNLNYSQSFLKSNLDGAQIDDDVINNYQNSSVFVLHPGVNFNYQNFDVGVSVGNLVTYNLTDSELLTDNFVYSGHVMYTTELDWRTDNEIRAMGYASKPGQQELRYGGNVFFEMKEYGFAQLGYNSFYGAALGIGVHINDYVSLGYTVEPGIGGAANVAEFGATHEFFAAYNFAVEKKRKRKRGASNPAYEARDSEIRRLKKEILQQNKLIRELRNTKGDSLSKAQRTMSRLERSIQDAKREEQKRARNLSLQREEEVKLLNKQKEEEEIAARKRLQLEMNEQKREEERIAARKKLQLEMAKQKKEEEAAAAKEEEERRVAAAAEERSEKEAEEIRKIEAAIAAEEAEREAEAEKQEAAIEAKEEAKRQEAEVTRQVAEQKAAEEEERRLAQQKKLELEMKAQKEEEERIASRKKLEREVQQQQAAEEEERLASQRKLEREVAERKAEEERIASRKKLEREVQQQQIEKEATQQAEEERLRQEAEAERLAAEEQARQEAETARLAEEQRLQEEAQAARLAEEERVRQEAAQQAEEERLRQEAEAERLAAEEQARQEAEAARLAEEQRLREEAEAARLAEEERVRQEAARQAEAERLRQEAEAERLAAEEQARQEAEAARLAEEQRLREEAEAARLAEEERLRQEAAIQAEAERLRQEAEAERLAAEEQARQEAEAARLAEEERLRQEAEEKARQEAETARLAQEIARQEAEAQAAQNNDADNLNDIQRELDNSSRITKKLIATRDSLLTTSVNLDKREFSKLLESLVSMNDEAEEVKRETDPSSSKRLTAKNRFIKYAEASRPEPKFATKYIPGYPEGYYLIGNVFKGGAYADKFTNTLNDLGFNDAQIILNPENQFQYVSIKSFTDRNEAAENYLNNIGNKYYGDMWILQIAKSKVASLKRLVQETRVIKETVKDDTVLTESLSYIGGHDIKNGYYLITNIFKRENYFERGMARLKSKGLEPKYFRNPKDNYIYVYLDRFDSLDQAKQSLFSNVNNTYDGELYILKIQ